MSSHGPIRLDFVRSKASAKTTFVADSWLDLAIERALQISFAAELVMFPIASRSRALLSDMDHISQPLGGNELSRLGVKPMKSTETRLASLWKRCVIVHWPLQAENSAQIGPGNRKLDRLVSNLPCFCCLAVTSLMAFLRLAPRQLQPRLAFGIASPDRRHDMRRGKIAAGARVRTSEKEVYKNRCASLSHPFEPPRPSCTFPLVHCLAIS